MLIRLLVWDVDYLLLRFHWLRATDFMGLVIHILVCLLRVWWVHLFTCLFACLFSCFIGCVLLSFRYEWVLCFLFINIRGIGLSSLDKYLDEQVLDMVAFKILDVLSYWIENVNRFKELSYTTYDVLMCLYHYGFFRIILQHRKLCVKQVYKLSSSFECASIVLCKKWVKGFWSFGS